MKMIPADTGLKYDFRDYFLAQRAAMGGYGVLLTEAGECDRNAKSIVFSITNAVMMHSTQPSLFFRALRQLDCLEPFFPEIARMIAVPQNPRFHPEGDVFVHSMLVLDFAAGLRETAVHALPFMYSALLHDLGKCIATQIDSEGRITAYGHEVQGDDLIIAQIRRLTDDEQLLSYVLNQTQLHMRPNMLYCACSKKKKTRWMFDLSLCPEDLILLSKADAMGKRDLPYDDRAETWLRDRMADYYQRLSVPMPEEADILRLGSVDREDLPNILSRARTLHFSGLDKRRILKQIMKEYMQN